LLSGSGLLKCREFETHFHEKGAAFSKRHSKMALPVAQ
jgi:hypothetical protein